MNAVILGLILLLAVSVPAEETADRSLAFGIYWPPMSFAATSNSTSKPLLRGELAVQLTNASIAQCVATITVTLSRPDDEASREYWNKRLAFPEHSWMSAVRVWDKQHQWLWPNLPYLLRLHGIERVERYGGTDPGKGIDDDFAGVLLRKYDARGVTESPDTHRAPLVSAEWHPVGVTGETDRETIVHRARSDAFTLHLGSAEKPAQGTIGVWLIYGDFLGTKPPRDWPKTPEYSGGILVFFEVAWTIQPDHSCVVTLRQTTPPHATGFDWPTWAKHAREQDGLASPAKLTDRDSNSK